MVQPSAKLADLAVVIVSHGDAAWLRSCLDSVFAAARGISMEVVVVANKPGDGTGDVVRARDEHTALVECENRGFAHGNNAGLARTSARYVLFLNPDTEVVAGSFAELLAVMEARPHVGLVGVRQISAAGELHPTLRRFPSAARALGDAIAVERWAPRLGWGERVVDPRVYEVETGCDWTSGSFMLVRREALLGAGLMDERFFLYSEEPDLCLRIRRAGWEIRHLPVMTIVHHAGRGGVRPRMVAQDVYARRQYAHKHFSAGHRVLYLSAVAARWILRAAPVGDRATAVARRAAARRALRTAVGFEAPPFRTPPATSVSAPATDVPDGG